MDKRIIKIVSLVFLGLFLATLPLVACDEDDEGTTVTTEQLKAITSAYDDVETYQFHYKVMGDFSFNDEKIDESNSAEYFGRVDTLGEKIHMVMSSEYENPEGTKLTEVQVYLIGDISYSKTFVSGISEEWEKEELSWQEFNLVRRNIEFLEDAEIEISGSENINGVECWIIKVTPSLEKCLEYGWVAEGASSSDLEEFKKSFSLKQWFAQDTYQLIKAEMELTQTTKNSSSYINSISEFSHYNEPVSINLPAEAEAAA